MKRGRRILAAALTLSLLIGQTAYAQEYMPASEAAVDTVAEEYEYDEAVETEQDESAKEVESETADVQNVNEKQTETVIQESESVPVLDTSDSYQELAVGNNTVTVNEGEITITSFTPEEDGIWKIYSTGDEDTYAYLYDSEMNQLAYSDDDGEDNNFELSFEMTVGETYYVGVKYYSDTNSGNVAVVVEKTDSSLEEEVIEELNEGTITVYVEAGERAIVSFTPLEDNNYIFYSEGDSDTYGYLYDSDMNRIAENDDGGKDRNFQICYSLEAGKKYYLGVEYWNSSTTGEISVTVKKMEAITEGENAIFVEAGGITIVSFTPSEDSRYRFYSEGESGAYGDLYDSAMTSIGCQGDREDGNFLIGCDMEAGRCYYLKVRNVSSSDSVDLTILVEKAVKPADEELVPVKDSNLNNALIKILDVDVDGYLIYDEMKKAKYLNLSSKNISDISGLEYAVNLQELELDNNDFSDPGPLAGLTHLTYLDISDTQVSDIAVLEGLSELDYLSLDNTPVSDIAPLAGLKKLEILKLSNDDISDFSALSNLENLDTLYIRNSTFVNLNSLKELKNLTELRLEGSAIQSLSGIEELSSLRDLYLAYTTGIPSLKPLIGLKQLQYIDLQDSDIATEARFELLVGEKDRTVAKGDSIIFGIDGLMDDIEYTAELAQGSEGISVQKDYYNRTEALAFKEGDVTLCFSCGKLYADVVITIVDESGSDEIGESIIDGAAVVDDDEKTIILDSNFDLWETYPEVKKAAENVKQYVSHYVYRIETDDSGKEERIYRENKYILDNNGDLWLDNEKIAENIKEIDGFYALDDQGNLVDIVNSDHPVLDNVVTWVSGRSTSASYAYALKNDGTVWRLYGSIDENKELQSAEQIAEGAIDLVKWSYYYIAYLKTDGSIMDVDGDCLYDPLESDSVKAVSLYDSDSEFIDNSLFGFYGDDNNFYLARVYKSTFLLNLGSIKVADVAYKGYRIFYILTDGGDIIKLDTSSSDNCASEIVASFAARLNHNSSSECDYQGTDGLYYHIGDDGIETVASSISKSVGNYELMEEYGGKQNVLVMYGETFLDQIVTTWKDTESGSIKYYALRVDGTIWDITGAPKKIGTIAEDEDEVENPFVDVSESSYYYDAVLWAYDQGITTGKDATHFLPDNTCTRAQVATFLWRAKGEPEPSTTENPFVDVKATDYYYKAVLWAYENGITTGKDATHFLPDSTVTRNQFVTFLWRAEGQPAATISNPFVDVPNGQYYTTAVLWAYENGITTGKDATHFLPANGCTRAQVAAFLYRAYQ